MSTNAEKAKKDAKEYIDLIREYIITTARLLEAHSAAIKRGVVTAKELGDIGYAAHSLEILYSNYHAIINHMWLAYYKYGEDQGVFYWVVESALQGVLKKIKYALGALEDLLYKLSIGENEEINETYSEILSLLSEALKECDKAQSKLEELFLSYMSEQ